MPLKIFIIDVYRFLYYCKFAEISSKKLSTIKVPCHEKRLKTPDLNDLFIIQNNLQKKNLIKLLRGTRKKWQQSWQNGEWLADSNSNNNNSNNNNNNSQTYLKVNTGVHTVFNMPNFYQYMQLTKSDKLYRFALSSNRHSSLKKTSG